ncbi:MAG: hypothetical protein IJA78_06790 [Clostridia bacterium]|nr:hypothetical protein [Clostridia bacterium]
MTAKELLGMVAGLRPHDYPDDVLLHWVDELEGRIALEIHGAAKPPRPVQTRMGLPLSAPAPYDRLYWAYLLAMLDLMEGAQEAYAASHALFREAYDAYARYVVRTGGGGV